MLLSRGSHCNKTFGFFHLIIAHSSISSCFYMLFQENAYGMTLGLSYMNCTHLADIKEMLNQVTKYN